MVQPPSALDATIKQLEADAAAHMRIARQNRELASKKRKLRDQLIAFCKQNGIAVVVEPEQED